MKRAAEWMFAALAVVLTGAFVSAVTGGEVRSAGEGSAATSAIRYFHGGKTPASFVEGGCRSAGCHVGMPHAKDRTYAVFRNMHVRFIDCLVCHGRDSRTSWLAEPPAPASKQEGGEGGVPGNRWKIAVRTPAIDRERMHGSVGPARSCRACHSDQGYRELTDMGMRDLPQGFANPVAMRMIEEGAKQWIPDTMR